MSDVDDIGGYLHHRTKEVERDLDFAARSFHGITAFQGTPEDNWGLPQGQPQWLLDAHNTKSGRCFLMGTGPSITKQKDLLAKLENEETFTVNRMKQWKDLPFTPTHHCIAEPGPVASWGKEIFPQYDFPKALNRLAINWWPVTAEGWLWINKAPDDIQCRWEGYWGWQDFLPPIPTAWASPLTIGQIALWLGYTELYFLGMDLTQVGQAWDVAQGRTAMERNIRSILECAERAQRDVTRAGRKIMDCTPGGRFNREGILEYVPLEEVLELC